MLYMSMLYYNVCFLTAYSHTTILPSIHEPVPVVKAFHDNLNRLLYIILLITQSSRWLMRLAACLAHAF